MAQPAIAEDDSIVWVYEEQEEEEEWEWRDWFLSNRFYQTNVGDVFALDTVNGKYIWE